MYLWLKLLHIVAVIVFLGNITTGIFWKTHAERTGDPRILAHVLDGIIWSDRVFTIPGVVLIVAGGVATAMVGGLPLLGTGWILWSIVLFTVSGLVFVLRLTPLQAQLRAVARAGAERGSLDWTRYRQVARAWEMWGLVALVTPLAALALMVLKPSL